MACLYFCPHSPLQTVAVFLTPSLPNITLSPLPAHGCCFCVFFPLYPLQPKTLDCTQDPPFKTWLLCVPLSQTISGTCIPHSLCEDGFCFSIAPCLSAKRQDQVSSFASQCFLSHNPLLSVTHAHVHAHVYAHAPAVRHLEIDAYLLPAQWLCVSQESVVLGPSARGSPGNLLEMQIAAPTPDF